MLIYWFVQFQYSPSIEKVFLKRNDYWPGVPLGSTRKVTKRL